MFLHAPSIYNIWGDEEQRVEEKKFRRVNAEDEEGGEYPMFNKVYYLREV